AIPAWKIAPALAYGNTVVIKPADLVPASTWALVDILHRAGLPKGVLNLVIGRGSEVGAALLEHPDVAAISFTGSVVTGHKVAAACVASRPMKKFQLELGGELLKRDAPGFYLQPALFTDVTNKMRIAREEIFGPVAAVIRVNDYAEALATANDTEFGLSAGICTASLKYASDFKRNAEAGMVMVNLPIAGVDYHVPFGGRKGSSFGPREQGKYAAEFYTAVKTAYTMP